MTQYNQRYNYTGQTFFVKKKDRGFRHVTSTAKLIIREALPIQCVEAVYLGAFFTAGMSEVRTVIIQHGVCLLAMFPTRVDSKDETKEYAQAMMEFFLKEHGISHLYLMDAQYG